jgi:hypothetical protein
MLSPAAAMGFAGAAAQPVPDQAAPLPPPPPPEGNAVSGVPIPVIGIWLGWVALAVYILTRNHHGGRFEFPQPGSPP